MEEKFQGNKSIDLDKEGFDKLLGGGKINSSFKIKVKKASEKALEKIKENDGEVTLLK